MKKLIPFVALALLSCSEEHIPEAFHYDLDAKIDSVVTTYDDSELDNQESAVVDSLFSDATFEF